MHNLVYTFTQLQPEDQTSQSSDQGNLNHCILAESPAACVNALGPWQM